MKIATHDSSLQRRSGKAESAILFSVGRQLFAIAADAVQEIRSTDSISGSAREFDEPSIPKVRHTLERGRHQYFVVNAAAHFHLPVSRPTLLLILRQLRVAVLVGRIEQMAEISTVFELPRTFCGEELRWYRGLTYLNDHVIPVIEPRGFLTAEEFRTLEAAAARADAVEGAVPA